MEQIQSLLKGQKSIIITTSENKYRVIEYLSNLNEIYNVKIISESEANQMIIGSCEKSALVEISENNNQIFTPEQLTIENAKLVSKQLEEIDLDTKYEETLLINLKKLKQELIKKGEYDFNPNLIKNFQQKQVILFDVLKTKKLANNLEKINAKTIKTITSKPKGTANLIAFSTIFEEVSYVANEIANKINLGVNPDKILIHMANNEYFAHIRYVFECYNINHDLKVAKTLYSYPLIKKIIEELDQTNELLTEIIQKYQEICQYDHEVKIIEALIKIINNYPKYHEDIKKVIPFIVYECQNKTINFQSEKNIVKFIDIENVTPQDDEYVYVLGFTQQKAPKLAKDDRVISDKLATKYIFETTSYINKNAKLMFQNKINSTKSIVLTYAKKSKSGEEVVSNIIFEQVNNCNIVDYQIASGEPKKYNFSSKLDQFNYAKAHELKQKFGTENNLIKTYQKTHELKRFDNQIRTKLINDIDELIISPTSIQSFYECQYFFYLEKILKIRRPIVDDSNIVIGNLFHKVLEKIVEHQKSDVEFVEKVIKNNDNAFKTYAKQYFLKKYKLHLSAIGTMILNSQKASKFTVEELEKEITIGLNQDETIKLTGVIDKYLTYELNDDKCQIAIIDYKTKSQPTSGATDYMFKIENGLEMQNMLYFKMLKDSDPEHQYELIGSYQHRVKPLKLMTESGYDQDFKLFGYTINDPNKIANLDENYLDPNESTLQNVKFKKGGEFNERSSRLLSEDGFINLSKTVSEKINEMDNDIQSGNFTINPKKYKNKNISCDYCKYQAICLKNKANFVELKGDTDE